MKEKVTLYNAGDGQEKSVRLKILKRWSRNGGVLLISDGLFRSSVKNEEMEEILSKPDAIVLDEAHTMLKKTENQTFKSLAKVDTKRRLCLTGCVL